MPGYSVYKSEPPTAPVKKLRQAPGLRGVGERGRAHTCLTRGPALTAALASARSLPFPKSDAPDQESLAVKSHVPRGNQLIFL